MLTAHASSLKSLQLTTVRLTSLHSDSDKPWPWTDLFIFLNEDMLLSSFTCTGWLAAVNGSMSHARGDLTIAEFWEVSDCDHLDCVNGAIQRYVIQQGIFPFEARVADDKPVLKGPQFPPEFSLEDECFCWTRNLIAVFRPIEPSIITQYGRYNSYVHSIP
jgi:hypothetical protein